MALFGIIHFLSKTECTKLIFSGRNLSLKFLAKILGERKYRFSDHCTELFSNPMDYYQTCIFRIFKLIVFQSIGNL